MSPKVCPVPSPAKMPPMTTQGHGRDGRPKIEHFFQVYKDLEGHQVSTEGFEGRSEALSVLETARARYAETHS